MHSQKDKVFTERKRGETIRCLFAVSIDGQVDYGLSNLRGLSRRADRSSVDRHHLALRRVNDAVGRKERTRTVTKDASGLTRYATMLATGSGHATLIGCP